MKKLVDRELEKMQARNQGLTTKEHRCRYTRLSHGISRCQICGRCVRTELLKEHV